MCDFSGLLKLKRFCSETGAFLASRAEVLGGQTWAETPHEGQRLCACQLSPAGLWAAVDNGLRRSGRQKLVVQGSVCLRSEAGQRTMAPEGCGGGDHAGGGSRRERTLGHGQAPSRRPRAAGALSVAATPSLVALPA